MKVLVVDDKAIDRKLLRVMLAAEGHQAVGRANGIEALECLDRETFDAVISDILMPGMDGYRLCYEVRRTKKHMNVPIIIYSSTYTSPADEQFALKAGADRFILKPAPASVLLDALRELSSGPRASAGAPSPAITRPDVLKEYSEKLVRKLQERNVELEAVKSRLLDANEGLHQANEALEKDIHERKRVEERVKHLAFHDALTGLPNRLLFHDRLTQSLNQARRHRTNLTIFFVDLDRFKMINDSLGHGVGDEVLRQAAARLQTCVREEDTLARLGGDEFVLLITGIPVAGAVIVAQKILEAMRQPFRVNERDLLVTASIGVSSYPADGKDAEALVRSADAAMYRAKDEGRDRYQVCRPGMDVESAQLVALENQLRDALQEEKFLLQYQPIVDLRSGEILAAEALLRLQAELGLVPPYEFIPVAENSGLIVPISRWVLHRACAQTVDWQVAGEARLAVAVNLSARQFQQPDLVGEVSRALEETGLPASCLDLEITESNAMQNVEHSANTLRRLKALGVRVSLDDFGTGYSSLSYLRRLPIDRIKIDHSFVHNVTNDPDDAAIVAAVIAMAHRLKLTVVAEGVETEQQLAFLRDHECDQTQGFLFSRPLDAPDFQALLRGGRRLTAPFQNLPPPGGLAGPPGGGH